MSLLRNLWYGNIRPNEQFFYYTSEYKLLITEASGVMEQLQKKLTPEEQLLLEGYCNTHTDCLIGFLGNSKEGTNAKETAKHVVINKYG